MPYVKRDPSGCIISASPSSTDSSDEEIAADSPELQTFLAQMTENSNPLETSDLKFIRAIEDLIDVLISKNLICITDLPAAVQSKLMERRSIRKSMGSLDLLGGDNETL